MARMNPNDTMRVRRKPRHPPDRSRAAPQTWRSGLGFGKTRAQNFEILAHLDRLQKFKLPILVGSSRKSFIQAIVSGEGLVPDRSAKGRRMRGLSAGKELLSSLPFGDGAAVAIAILNGAHIVRVHDVEQMVPAVRIADAVAEAGGRGLRGG